MRYDLNSTHRWMLRDSVRVEAFAGALQRVLRPGQVVLDVGAGSGILSLLAARAGAARVYAVEMTEIAALTGELIARNGFGNVITVIQADICTVQLPEKVDVIISEWLGTVGVDENLLYPVLVARDRWLKPNGTMIPNSVAALLAPVWLPMRSEADFLRDNPYGFDLSPLAETSVHDLLLQRRQIHKKNFAAPAQQLWIDDLAKTTVRQSLLPNRAELSFTIDRPGKVGALAAWFNASMASGVNLTNAPDHPETHWGQLLLPLKRVLEVSPTDVLRVNISCLPRIPGLSDFAWSVKLNEQPWEHHDTRINEVALQETQQSARNANLFSNTIQGTSDMPSTTPYASFSSKPTGQPSQYAPLTPENASSLTRFLAQLSVDPQLLMRLIASSEDFFNESGLSLEDQQALMSRDASHIEAAMMKGANP